MALPQPTSANLGKLRDEELIALHDHKNEWYARRARLVLQYQRSSENLMPGRSSDCQIGARLAATADDATG